MLMLDGGPRPLEAHGTAGPASSIMGSNASLTMGHAMGPRAIPRVRQPTSRVSWADVLETDLSASRRASIAMSMIAAGSMMTDLGAVPSSAAVHPGVGSVVHSISDGGSQASLVASGSRLRARSVEAPEAITQTLQPIHTSGDPALIRLIRIRDVTASMDFVRSTPAAARTGNPHTGVKPIHVACAIGSAPLVELLVTHGATVNGYDNAGRLPLTIAIRQHNVEVVRTLLALRAKPNFRSSPEEHAEPPLFAAVEEGLADSVEALLAYGATVDAVGAGLETPLMRAARFDHLDVVRKLLAGGANPLLTNVRSESAIDIALDFGSWRVYAFLRGASLPDAVTVRAATTNGSNMSSMESMPSWMHGFSHEAYNMLVQYRIYTSASRLAAIGRMHDPQQFNRVPRQCFVQVGMSDDHLRRVQRAIRSRLMEELRQRLRQLEADRLIGSWIRRTLAQWRFRCLGCCGTSCCVNLLPCCGGLPIEA